VRAPAAADNSAKAALASIRAWLHIQAEILGDLHFDAEGNGRLRLGFTVKNIGKLPAINVDLYPSINLYAGPWKPTIELIQQHAEHNAGLPAVHSGILVPGGIQLGQVGLVLIPDEAHTFLHELKIFKTKMDEDPRTVTGEPPLFIEVWAIARYTYPMANVRAHTAIIRRLVRDTSEGVSRVFQRGETVGAVELRLERESLFSESVS
jgi:hypothetical protein